MKYLGSIYNLHSLALLSKTFSYIPCGIFKTTSPIHSFILILLFSLQLFSSAQSWCLTWPSQGAFPRINFHLPHRGSNAITRYENIIVQPPLFLKGPRFTTHIPSLISILPLPSLPKMFFSFSNHFQQTAHSFSRLGEYYTNNLSTEILT